MWEALGWAGTALAASKAAENVSAMVEIVLLNPDAGSFAHMKISSRKRGLARFIFSKTRIATSLFHGAGHFSLIAAAWLAGRDLAMDDNRQGVAEATG